MGSQQVTGATSLCFTSFTQEASAGTVLSRNSQGALHYLL